MAKAKKQKNGKWRVLAYDYTDSLHKRHYKSFTAETKKEAEYLAAAYIACKTDNTSYDTLTLNEAFNRYIESRVGTISPSTVAGYKKIQRTSWEMLMPMRLSKIKPENVQTAVSELSSRCSAKTVRNAYGLLHAVMKTYNSTLDLSRVQLPQKEKVEVFVPTTDEINKLLEVADEHIRVPILLASQGSLRRSEICALTIDDFSDFGVNINKAVVNDEKGSPTLKNKAKTFAGNRFVPLSAEVIKECRNWKHFGIEPNILTHHYYACRNKVPDNPKFKFHALRHYFASELHEHGVPDKEIARLGGWESVETLQRIYQHAMRDKTKPTDDKVINIFSDNFNQNKKCNAKCNAK